MSSTSFAGSVPALYQSHFVPLLFEPYAQEVARRVAASGVRRVLETAAGTGVVTRALAAALPGESTIVATDLNQPMLDQASALGTARPVEWRQADALRLPFEDRAFDAVVCQFGAMFFPDKPKGFSEARRVLRPGGIFFVSVWDRIEDNEITLAAEDGLATVFPADPPRFMRRLPHGYHDAAAVARDLAAGGFTAPPRIETIALRSRAPSARHAAVAYCQGTPLRAEIEERDPSRLEEATAAVERMIASRFGQGPIDAKMQAHLIAIEA